MLIDELAQLISSRERAFITVGTDGGQGSGKSTIINSLAKILISLGYNVVNLETDDFLVERKFRQNLSDEFFTDPENVNKLFDFRHMRKSIDKLKRAKLKDVVTIENLYTSKTGERSNSKKFEILDRNIILLGGPYLLHPLIREAFDLLVFIKVSRAKRLSNTQIRNTQKKYRSDEEQTRLFNLFEKFFKFYYKDIKEMADIIVDNEDFLNPNITVKT